jgi:hypothetical protein
MIFTGSYTIKEGSPAPNQTEKGVDFFKFNVKSGEIK